jgi:hypothetical protein
MLGPICRSFPCSITPTRCGGEIQKMRCREIRDAAAQRRQPAAAAGSIQEKRSGPCPALEKIAQHAQARVIASRSEQKPAPFGADFSGPWLGGAPFDPGINQFPGEGPFTGDSGARNLLSLGQRINLLLVDPQIAGHLPGIHQFGYGPRHNSRHSMLWKINANSYKMFLGVTKRKPRRLWIHLGTLQCTESDDMESLERRAPEIAH